MWNSYCIYHRRLEPHIKAYSQPAVLPPSQSHDDQPIVVPVNDTDTDTDSSDTDSSDNDSSGPESPDSDTDTDTSVTPTPGTPTSDAPAFGDNLPPPPSRPQATVRRKKNRDFIIKLQALQTVLDENRYASNSCSTKK